MALNKKVIVLCGPLSRSAGGVYFTSFSLTNRLRNNNDLQVMVLGHKDKYSTWDEKRYKALKKYYKVLGNNKIGFSLDLIKILISEKPDIIHTQSIWIFLSFATFIYSKLINRKCRVIISPHGMLDKHQLSTSRIKKKIAMLLFERANLNSAYAIHALNIEEANSIRAIGIKSKIEIVPNGVDLPVVKNVATKEKEEKTLLFIGRINRKKNIDNLLRAWYQSDFLHYNWRLILAGNINDDLEYFEELKGYLKDESVIFKGGCYGTDKEKVFLESNAFILPSYSEGLPMAVLEAWSHKLPTLISKKCNLSLGFELNAALDCGTEELEIINCLNILFRMSSSKLEEMGLNGYELVKDRFNWDKIAQRFTNLYLEPQ